MPALPADIVRATRAARIVTRVDTAIQTAFDGARDAAQSPERGFFETAADATTVLNMKAALSGTFRRRFVVSVADEVWIDPLAGIPTATLIDSESGFSGPALVTRVEVDLENETTSLEVLG